MSSLKTNNIPFEYNAPNPSTVDDPSKLWLETTDGSGDSFFDGSSGDEKFKTPCKSSSSKVSNTSGSGLSELSDFRTPTATMVFSTPQIQFDTIDTTSDPPSSKRKNWDVSGLFDKTLVQSCTLRSSVKKSRPTVLFDGIEIATPRPKKHSMITRLDSIKKTPLLSLRNRSIVKNTQISPEQSRTILSSSMATRGNSSKVETAETSIQEGKRNSVESSDNSSNVSNISSQTFILERDNARELSYMHLSDVEAELIDNKAERNNNEVELNDNAVERNNNEVEQNGVIEWNGEVEQNSNEAEFDVIGAEQNGNEAELDVIGAEQNGNEAELDVIGAEQNGNEAELDVIGAEQNGNEAELDVIGAEENDNEACEVEFGARNGRSTLHENVAWSSLRTNTLRSNSRKDGYPESGNRKLGLSEIKKMTLAEQVYHFHRDTPPRFRTLSVKSQPPKSISCPPKKVQITVPTTPISCTGKRLLSKSTRVVKPSQLSNAPAVSKALKFSAKKESAEKWTTDRRSTFTLGPNNAQLPTDNSSKVFRFTAVPTKVQPFSFDARDQLFLERKRQRIDKLKEGVKVPVFRASKLPNYLKQSGGLVKSHSCNALTSEENKVAFKAKAATVLTKKPFMTRKRSHPLSQITGSILNTETD